MLELRRARSAIPGRMRVAEDEHHQSPDAQVAGCAVRGLAVISLVLGAEQYQIIICLIFFTPSLTARLI